MELDASDFLLYDLQIKFCSVYIPLSPAFSSYFSLHIHNRANSMILVRSLLFLPNFLSRPNLSHHRCAFFSKKKTVSLLLKLNQMGGSETCRNSLNSLEKKKNFSIAFFCVIFTFAFHLSQCVFAVSDGKVGTFTGNSPNSMNAFQKSDLLFPRSALSIHIEKQDDKTDVILGSPQSQHLFLEIIFCPNRWPLAESQLLLYLATLLMFRPTHDSLPYSGSPVFANVFLYELFSRKKHHSPSEVIVFILQYFCLHGLNTFWLTEIRCYWN